MVRRRHAPELMFGRASATPQPTHDLLDTGDVAEMVRRFYRDVAQDDLLGPMFNEVARVDWSEHLPKLTAFWCRALFGTQGYAGNPFRAHQLIHAQRAFTVAHFERWLELFYETVEMGWVGANRRRSRPSRPTSLACTANSWWANGRVSRSRARRIMTGETETSILEFVDRDYQYGFVSPLDINLSSPLVKLIFAGGTEDIQNGVDFFWEVRREKMEPEQVERVLAYWEAALGWARTQRTVNETLLSRLSRLAPYFSALDGRAKSLLLGVIGYVHSDYSTDQTIEQLDRLVDFKPRGNRRIARQDVRGEHAQFRSR